MQAVDLERSIKLLYLSFELPLFSVELPQWFETWKAALPEISRCFTENYPLMQLRCKENKGAVLVINEAVEMFRQGLNQMDWNLPWKNGNTKLLIDHMELHEHFVQALERPKLYRLFRWVAMDETEVANWDTRSAFIHKIEYLEQQLRTQLSAALCILSPTVDIHNIQVQISDWRQSTRIRMNGQFYHAFDLTFTASHSLPPLIGIGHGVALGFGWMVPYVAKKTAIQ